MHTMHGGEDEPEPEYLSYPPSPYLPVSDGHLSQHPSESFMADSSSEEGINLDFPFNTKNRTPVVQAKGRGKPNLPDLKDSDEEDNEVFAYNPGGFDTHAQDEDEEGVMDSPTRRPRRPPPVEARAPSVYSSSSSGKSKFQLPRQFGMEVDSDEDPGI